MTPLARLLLDAKGDRSVDSLIAEAERRGVTVNPTARATVYKALKGDHAKNPREETVQLFASVFALDLRDVRQAAGKPRGELGRWVPTNEAHRLDQEQRDALDALIKAIVRTGGEAGGDTAATSQEVDTDLTQEERDAATRVSVDVQRRARTGERLRNDQESEREA